ncbi:MAG: PrsW family intramembrane metalloprotease [Clostridiales bacterium]|nr:PrsW family intramembrane metalloprotease [Clostridiales bacterium]
MTTLIALGLSPALICLFYIYIRDKYEKEPLRLLALGVFAGLLIAMPIMRTAGFVAAFMPPVGQIGEAIFISFAVAGFVEEGFKFAALYFLIWRDRNLNEKMDGIVYAVFISLGFAAVENVLYVLHPTMGGMGTALGRAIISVPAHGIFGVIMGYYFAMAKFEPGNRKKFILCAFLIPLAVHGIYNSLLLSGQTLLLVVFAPFLAFMWIDGHKKIRAHLAASPFKSGGFPLSRE